MSTCRRRISDQSNCQPFSSTGLAFLAAGALSIFLPAGRNPFSKLLQSFGSLHFPNEQLVNRLWTDPVDESSSSTQPKYTPLKIFFLQLLMPLITAYPPNRHLI
ncbi:Conserved hypothetical protein [Trichinella spiralis]|uniref:hypothetical protein n=1 Tax=Trichinella spiralis TaxID=6334 RepID=UPI0001EFC712|nr:Conserved hypothetical protein [Trichinella spiralis]